MKLFESYVLSFQEFLTEHNCSERTVETYTYHAGKFVQFLEKHYPRVQSPEKVTREVIRDYQQYLAGYRDRTGRPLSSRTQILKLRILRSFFAFLVSQDLILRNPVASISLPREEQRLIRNTLSQKEVLEMLRALRGNDPTSIRNRAIVELFYSCGLRTTELCQLKVQEVDFQEQTVTILKGKGGKPRVIPIGQYAAYYLQRYLDKGRKYMLKGKREDAGFLFLSQRGQPFNKTTINKCVMRSVARKLGTKKHLSCYTMRHYAERRIMPNHCVDSFTGKDLANRRSA